MSKSYPCPARLSPLAFLPLTVLCAQLSERLGQAKRSEISEAGFFNIANSRTYGYKVKDFQ